MMEKWLKTIEDEYDIDILFACESGSRAWGTDTPESDYDVRFIYKLKDIRSYLSIEREKEVIDIKNPYDAHGWDIFKAFHLIRKSNPSIFEWSFSPIIYKDTNHFSDRLKGIVKKDYSPFALFQHYKQLMSRNMKEIMKKDSYNNKTQKQLIQAVRALLIARSIVETKSVRSDWLYKELQTAGDILSDFYRKLIDAKKSGFLISESYAETILYVLEEEKETISQQAETLSKGGDPASELNKWLWDLLEI